jgi:tetratricopeptide (TPR) repeat protein
MRPMGKRHVRLLVGLLLLLLPSFAAAQDARKATALEKFEAGKTAYRLGDYDGAIREWTEAYKLKTDPVFLFNIAQAYREKKEFEKAITFYNNYLKEEPNAPNRATVEKRIAEMKEALEKQQQASDRPPSGPLRPGERPPYAPEAEDRGARSPGRPLKLGGIVAGSAGAALIVTGLIFGIMSNSDKSDIESAIRMGQPWSQDLADKESSGKTKATIANVTLGLGLVGVVGGGVLYYFGWRKDRAVEVRPEATAHGMGATLIVRY